MTSDLIRFDVFKEFRMSDVLVTNLMLTGLLFLFSAFPLLLGWKEATFLIFIKLLSAIPHLMLSVIVPNWVSSAALGSTL